MTIEQQMQELRALYREVIGERDRIDAELRQMAQRKLRLQQMRERKTERLDFFRKRGAELISAVEGESP